MDGPQGMSSESIMAKGEYLSTLPTSFQVGGPGREISQRILNEKKNRNISHSSIQKPSMVVSTYQPQR